MINLIFVNFGYSGAGTYCKELISGLANKEKVRIYVVHNKSYDYKEYAVLKDDIHDSVTNIYFPKIEAKGQNLDNYYKYCCILLRPILSPERQTVVHINQDSDYPFAKWAKSLFNAKVVFTLHYLSDYFYYQEITNDYKGKDWDVVGDEKLKDCLIQCDKIICVTAFAKKAIMETYNINEEKIEIIYNGVGDSNNSIEPANLIEKVTIKKQLGFDSEDRILLYLRAIKDEKGIFSLINVFKKLVDQFHNLRLIIAGEGDFNKAMEQCNGIWNKVIFTGLLNQENVSKFYQIAEIGVLPSKFEQCSYTVLEMMMNHVPMVITSSPGLVELGQNGRNALIANVKAFSRPRPTIDEDDLYIKLVTLLENNELKNEISQNAFTAWQSYFTAEKMSKKTYEIYNEMSLS